MSEWTLAFEAFSRKLLEQAKAPGAIVALAQDGKLLYSQTVGWRNREEELPITLDTVFGIASVTKSFTCAAIMKLQEAGKLAVTDPILQYLPEFAFLDERWTKEITIHHLMTHTPGMPPFPFLDGALKRSMEQDPIVPGTVEEEEIKPLPYLDTYADVMEAIASYKGKPLGPPGEAFSYNNDGYGLLGAIIEQVSGQTYEAYVAEHILRPLGMSRTVFHVAELDDQEDVTVLYKRMKRDGEEQVVAAPFWRDAPAMRACGLLKSTARDLLAYLEMYRGAAALLADASLEQMTQPHARCDGYRSYGYGWMVSPAFPDGVLIEHGGSLKGVSSHIFFLPQKGLTGVVLCNADGVPVRELAVGLLNAMAGREPDAQLYPIEARALDPRLHADYVGTYKSDEWMELSIESRDAALFLTVDGQSYPLIPADTDAFVFKRGNSVVWIDFFRSADGEVQRVSYALRQLFRMAP
ncbi:serine hydrolase [Brevibacillus sp. TJ4]|uniref:serine hydrolase n=1 Tax=Brevibacillus sp. TJ4 TaxID=3234853 RepID=UPI003BA30BD8